MQLEAANLMVFKAASLYDAGLPCGPYANSAKYLGAEAGHNACQTAVLTLGGMGYAKEYHVERLLRESYIPRIAPVSPQLIMCFIAEKVRSEEHTSELQSLMRISYAVFCLKKKTHKSKALN